LVCGSLAPDRYHTPQSRSLSLLRDWAGKARARTESAPARAQRDYFGVEESLAGGEAGGEAAGVDDALLFFFFEEWCVV